MLPALLLLCELVLPNGSLTSLLDKAKELEKSYDWMGASELYAKACELCLQTGDSPKAAGLIERVGFCFYRAAFQAQTDDEFRERMKQSIQAYEKEIQILGQTNQADGQVRINQAKALLAYTQSRYETSPQKRRELLDGWWALEHQVLEAWEKAGDSYSVGRTCNDLIEFWIYDMDWLIKESSKEQLQIDELKKVAEKAIRILSKLDDDYELARAYCFATWHYSWVEWESLSANETNLFRQKCTKYSKEALELSKKTGDAWLISWSYASAWMAAR